MLSKGLQGHPKISAGTHQTSLPFQFISLPFMKTCTVSLVPPFSATLPPPQKSATDASLLLFLFILVSSKHARNILVSSKHARNLLVSYKSTRKHLTEKSPPHSVLRDEGNQPCHPQPLRGPLALASWFLHLLQTTGCAFGHFKEVQVLLL